MIYLVLILICMLLWAFGYITGNLDALDENYIGLKCSVILFFLLLIIYFFVGDKLCLIFQKI